MPPAKPPAAKGAKPKPTRLVTYAQSGETALRLHVFEPPEHKAGDGRPAIVFFFGGGWVGGSPSQFYPQAAHFARRGMVAISAEYRVKKRHGVTPFECVADGKAAMAYVAKNAEKLGVDRSRIVVSGGSAGGHVAACTVLVPSKQAGKGGATAAAPAVQAMVLFNPVIDTGPKGFGHNRLKDRYKDLSPVELVRPKLPPTILFYGTKDTTTPLAGARLFQERMKQAGNRCELLTYEGYGHGFFNRGEPYEKTLAAADAFLVSLGILRPAE